MLLACGRIDFEDTSSAVVLDSTGPGVASADGVTSLGLTTLDVGVGANECLIAGLVLSNQGATDIALRWNGTGMTPVTSSPLPGTSGVVFVYRLIAPDVGRQTLTADWTGESDAILGAVSFAGADQAECVHSVSTARGTSTMPAVAVPSAPGHMTVDVSATTSAFGTATQTQQWQAMTHGSPRLIQHATHAAMATTDSCTFATAPTAGHDLVFVGAGAGSTLLSVTGAGVTWQRAAASTTNSNMEIRYGEATSGSDATVTYTGSISSSMLCWAGELTGLDRSGFPRRGERSVRESGPGTSRAARDDQRARPAGRRILEFRDHDVGVSDARSVDESRRGLGRHQVTDRIRPGGLELGNVEPIDHADLRRPALGGGRCSVQDHDHRCRRRAEHRTRCREQPPRMVDGPGEQLGLGRVGRLPVVGSSELVDGRPRFRRPRTLRICWRWRDDDGFGSTDRGGHELDGDGCGPRGSTRSTRSERARGRGQEADRREWRRLARAWRRRLVREHAEGSGDRAHAAVRADRHRDGLCRDGPAPVRRWRSVRATPALHRDRVLHGGGRLSLLARPGRRAVHRGPHRDRVWRLHRRRVHGRALLGHLLARGRDRRARDLLRRDRAERPDRDDAVPHLRGLSERARDGRHRWRDDRPRPGDRQPPRPRRAGVPAGDAPDRLPRHLSGGARDAKPARQGGRGSRPSRSRRRPARRLARRGAPGSRSRAQDRRAWTLQRSGRGQFSTGCGARARCDGRRLRSGAYRDRSAGGAQAARPHHARHSGCSRTVLSRGRGRREARVAAHRPAVRGERGRRRRSLSRHGTSARSRPLAGSARAQAVAAGRGRRAREPDRAWPGSGTHRGDRPACRATSIACSRSGSRSSRRIGLPPRSSSRLPSRPRRRRASRVRFGTEPTPRSKRDRGGAAADRGSSTFHCGQRRPALDGAGLPVYAPTPRAGDAPQCGRIGRP